jgi:hypothetical protein
VKSYLVICTCLNDEVYNTLSMYSSTTPELISKMLSTYLVNLDCMALADLATFPFVRCIEEQRVGNLC